MSQDEFKQFMDGDPVAPPRQVSETILARVHRELSPGGWLVFAKLLALHSLTAIFTLSFCPQLGFRLFGDGPGLMHYFMGFGQLGCMMACGFFFLASSLLVASLVLKPEELRVVRHRRWAELGSIAVLSFGFFFAWNPEVLLSVAILWLMGAFAGGLLALELGWRIRLARYA